MKLIIKIIILFLIFALFFILTYFVIGDRIEILFTPEKCIGWFSSAKSYAWMAGILLLISDILLPVPATGIMAALGAVYGLWQGAVINLIGSTGAGIIGYAAARYIGKRGSHFIASEEEIKKFSLFFDQWGPYAIIISRVMPILPEVIAILAGLSRMKFIRFLAALLGGTIPVSFLFSWMGTYSGFAPGTGIIVAIILPALVWPIFIKIVKI